MNIAYNETQIDSLQEIINISMGQAAASLARLFDSFIELSVPYIKIFDAQDINDKFDYLRRNHSDYRAVKQAFFNGVRGESIVVYHDTKFSSLAELIGLSGLNDEEIMFDINNILVGATLCGIADQLQLEIGFNPPSLYIPGENNLSNWKKALYIEIFFQFESKDFVCNMLLLLSEDSLEKLGNKIDQLLNSL